MARLDKLLKYLKSCDGSDLHLVAGQTPRVRSRGLLEPLPGGKPMSNTDVRGLVRELVSDGQWELYESKLELDFAYEIPGVARFRANLFCQARGSAAVFRLIPDQISTAEELGLPESVKQFAHLKSGLVLVTGPTGSGKSTTLAAIVDIINSTYERHVITIEDPIEFVHPRKRALISQREVGTHTKGFARALRSALRQNPDVLLLGELRNEEVELAVSAAEMGLLVFGTLHTNSAAKTVDRLIDAVPEEMQDQVRTGLSEVLSGIVSQILVRTRDGRGRRAAIEVLVRTSGLPNLIREGNTPQIASMVQSGRAYGMQLMDDHLAQLVQEGVIDARDAYMACVEKERFAELMG